MRTARRGKSGIARERVRGAASSIRTGGAATSAAVSKSRTWPRFVGGTGALGASLWQRHAFVTADGAACSEASQHDRPAASASAQQQAVDVVSCRQSAVAMPEHTGPSGSTRAAARIRTLLQRVRRQSTCDDSLRINSLLFINSGRRVKRRIRRYTSVWRICFVENRTVLVSGVLLGTLRL